jgi:hypothetical protein
MSQIAVIDRGVTLPYSAVASKAFISKADLAGRRLLCITQKIQPAQITQEEIRGSALWKTAISDHLEHRSHLGRRTSMGRTAGPGPIQVQLSGNEVCLEDAENPCRNLLTLSL